MDRPRLNIRLLSLGQIELSWPATATRFVLETTGASLASDQWLPVSSTGGNT